MRENPQALMVRALAVLVIAGLVGVFAVSEIRRQIIQRTAVDVQNSLDRLAKLAEFEAVVGDAEGSLRSYLLTGAPRYKDAFEAAVANAPRALDQLAQLYMKEGSPGPSAFRQLAAFSGVRFGQLFSLRDLFDAKGGRAAIDLLDTGLDDRSEQRVTALITELRAAERDNVRRRNTEWTEEHKQNRLFMALITLAVIVLVVVTASLALNELRNRRDRARELESIVAARTSELASLTSHLQSSVEEEKANLARELHDELGGLLVSAKMDLNQLKSVLPANDEQSAARVARMDKALADGVRFKRRIVEELRPTLLDNLGLIPALRWQVEQACAAAGLNHELNLPEEEPAILPQTRIGLFRIVQEALNNIMKHASASTVWLDVALEETHLRLSIADDGVGLKDEVMRGKGGHGLTGMRHRVRGMGGRLMLGQRAGGGTLIEVIVSLEAREPDGQIERGA
ncbi:MAG: histidine kinase [Steroidobacteraceae bacterium]